MTKHEWGPTHKCPECGSLVEWYSGPWATWGLAYDTGTLHRHGCPTWSVPIMDGLHQCVCGADLDGNTELATGKQHECLSVPKEPTPVKPKPEPPIPIRAYKDQRPKPGAVPV